MHTRRAVPADAHRIAQLHVGSWQAAYKGVLPQAFLNSLEPGGRLSRWEAIVRAADWPRQGTLVVEERGELVGFASPGPARHTADIAVGEIAALYVAPSRWRSGVGSTLMDAALSQLVEAGFTSAVLWVLVGNQRAIQSYEATGWHTDGLTKHETIGGKAVTQIRMSRALR